MVTLTPNFLLNPAAPENICSRKNYVNDINYCVLVLKCLHSAQVNPRITELN